MGKYITILAAVLLTHTCQAQQLTFNIQNKSKLILHADCVKFQHHVNAALSCDNSIVAPNHNLIVTINADENSLKNDSILSAVAKLKNSAGYAFVSVFIDNLPDQVDHADIAIHASDLSYDIKPQNKGWDIASDQLYKITISQ